MTCTLVRSAPLAMLLLIASSANAQVSQSPGHKLSVSTLEAAGGGSSSANYAAWTSLGLLSTEPMSSANAKSNGGFVPPADPQPSNAPVIFGLSPITGNKAGGTPVTITGVNFDKFGSGPTMLAFFGGSPAINVQVQSNTTMTLLTPPGLAGYQIVTILNTYGVNNKLFSWVYNPAITTTPSAPIGTVLSIKNYGTVGKSYRTFISTATCSLAVPPYGTLLIGPFPFLELISQTGYPGPDGISQIGIPIPDAPILHGFIVHFQSLAIQSPSQASLTNMSTTAIP